MTASFVVYVDESGDEGFVFTDGSSHWFVLSAVIIEKEHDLETVKLVDEVRAILERKDQEPLHFRKLKHEHRLPFLQKIAGANLKAISVMVDKTSITNVETFQQKYRLYFYATRLLLERVSWYCRDHRTSHTQGDGTAEIIFSNRGGMKYDEMREYLNTLKEKTWVHGVQIDWNVIAIDQITAYASKRMGLQIADAVASSFYFGVQLNKYGFCEDRYARMLQSVVYHNKSRYNGYGLKFWPAEAEIKVKNESHLAWLRDVYSF